MARQPAARASPSAARGRPGRARGRPRWTRRIGRSCDSIAAKSPSAWASISRPNVYGQPGIGRSTGWSDGELEEPAGRRAALVELAGRVQEARAVAGRRRAARSRRGGAARIRSSAASRAGRRRDERLEREVGVRPAPGEMPRQLADERAVARGQPERGVAVEREAGRASATSAAGGGGGVAPTSAAARTRAGQLLGLLDVRLVERVDPEDGAGDRGRDLPADELARRGRSGRRARSGSPGGRRPRAASGERRRRRRPPRRPSASRTNTRSAP